MKKVITLILVTVLLASTLIVSPALAAKPDGVGNGNPLQALWDAIDQTIISLTETIEDAVVDLQELIDAEETARIAGDQDVSSAAQAANDSLQALLEANRIAGDTATLAAAQALDEALENVVEANRIAGDAATLAAAQALDEALENVVEANRIAGDAATLAAAQALDEALQGVFESAINIEEDARISADNNLQTQINSIGMPEFGETNDDLEFGDMDGSVWYTADTDGFVNATIWVTPGKYGSLWGTAKGHDPYDYISASASAGPDSGWVTSICFPVRKGYSWHVDYYGETLISSGLFWTPITN